LSDCLAVVRLEEPRSSKDFHGPYAPAGDPSQTPELMWCMIVLCGVCWKYDLTEKQGSLSLLLPR
jgi:hypothetical protein